MARRALILTLAAACGTSTGPKTEDTDPPKVVDTFAEDSDTDEGGSNGGNNLGIVPDTDTDTDVEAPACAPPTDDKLASACDLSVNTGKARVASAGEPLVLEVTSTDTPTAGGFNAATRDGNLALAGFHGFTKEPLAARATISLEARRTTADTLPFEVRLIVDLDCNGGQVIQLVLDAARMTQTPSTDGFLTYAITPGTAAWFALGRLNGTSGVLLWGASDTPQDGAVGKTLDDLLTAHPAACLRNVNNTAFRDMPRGDVISAALLSLGASLDARATSRWEVRQVSWGDKTFVR